MRSAAVVFLGIGVVTLAACGPSPEEEAAARAAQHADDQSRCFGYGFQPNTDAFGHCMLVTATQRDAQAAADRRMAAAQAAETQRQQAVLQARKDAADKDAWDRRTGQGAYAASSSGSSAMLYSPPQYPTSPSNPVDAVRDSIQRDMDKMENAGTVSP